MKSKLLFGLLVSFSLFSFAQELAIKGTVYDEYSNVLSNATINVRGTTTGATTDEMGQFFIRANTNTILKVSYLGFESKEITINSQQEIIVILKTKWQEIDAVVIEVDTNHCKCSNLPEIVAISTKFIRIPSEQQLNSLFPNPSANGLFQLQLSQNYTKLTLEVYNINGQLLQSNTHTKLSKNPEIDLSKHPKGVYLIRIVADGKLLETKKAIRS